MPAWHPPASRRTEDWLITDKITRIIRRHSEFPRWSLIQACGSSVTLLPIGEQGDEIYFKLHHANQPGNLDGRAGNLRIGKNSRLARGTGSRSALIKPILSPKISLSYYQQGKTK